MKDILGLLLLLLLMWPLLATEAASTKSTTLAITHLTVIDATGAPARPDMTVLVNGNRITKVGKSAEIRVPNPQ